MKRQLFVTVLLLFLSSTIFAQNYGSSDSSGSGYVNSANKFSVLFPGEPNLSTKSLDSEVGKVTVNTFIGKKGSSEIYMVAVTEFTMIIPDNAYSEMKKNFLIGMKLELTSQEDVRLNGRAGYYFEGKKDALQLYGTFFFKGNRMYTVICGRNGGSLDTPSIVKYLMSFVILD